jgi:drug/metabolite transporter (DMT)-like permease
MTNSGKVQKYWDWFLVVVINFMWATQVPVIRLIGDRLGPVTLAYVPMILSTAIFLPVFWNEQRKRGTGLRWQWKDAKHFLLAGFFGVFLMQFLYTLGSRWTLAANAGVITLTIPVTVAIFASFFLKERLNIVRILSFFLALLGVLLTSLTDLRSADFRHSQYLAGNLVFLLACFCCGFFNTYCKFLVERKYTELEILVYTTVIGSLSSIPLLLWVEPFHLSEFLRKGTVAIGGILELSFIVYGVSMLLFFYVLKRMDVTQAILGNYLLPLFIAMLGILLLGESITALTLTGGAIIVVSTLMVTVYEADLLKSLDRWKAKRAEWSAE